MKPLLFILLSLTCFSSFGQTTYYFSNNGNDNNTGTITSPLKTIDKLNKLLLKPGDNVRFHCGDSFSGQLSIKASGTQASPIIFDSYGEGNKPIINGAAEIKNWVKIPDKNIWQASVSASVPITDLYINSKNAPLGRYPKANSANKGFLTIASHNGKTELTSKENITGNWVGGELVYMPNQWLMERCKIIAQNGNTFTLTKPDAREIADNWGFFIQNNIAALTTDGEWCFDTNNNTVSLYYSKGNPNSQKIEVTYFSKGIAIAYCSNVIIQNLEIDKTVNNAVSGYNISNVTFNNLKIDQSGEDGIKIQGACDNILIENNSIDHTNNDGVNIIGATNIKFINNIIENTGVEPGRGDSNVFQYTGIDYASDGGHAVFQGNRINNVGFNGICFKADNILIKNNVITNFCLVKSDGGGIDTWNGNHLNYTHQTITGNIIIGAQVDLNPINHIRPHIDGIYLDDCSQNIIITDNSIANCVNSGIYLHGSKNVTVTGNTCYNNGVQFSFNIGACDDDNNTIQNNIFFSGIKNQPVAIYGKNRDERKDYGQFANNFYVSPHPELSMITGYPEENSQTHRVSFSNWKAEYSKDADSHFLGGNNIYNNEIKIVYNGSSQPKTMPLSGSYKDVKNNIFNGQVTLQPYSSAILLKTN